MSNKQQTAVQWLRQEFIKLESTTGVFGVMYELLDKAEGMEKEQIIDALLFGDVLSLKTAENYYNETYGGSNEQR
jgi:hypothetical protein